MAEASPWYQATMTTQSIYNRKSVDTNLSNYRPLPPISRYLKCKMMQTNPAQYRLRLLSDVLRGIVLPSVVLSSISRLLHVRFGLLAIPAHVFFIAIWIIARSLYTQRRHFLEAHQLGARPIPCVKGKWPGNIDVLLRMLKAFKKSYVLDVYRDLFEEYKCTTLNTRILWVDQVGGVLILNTASRCYLLHNLDYHDGPKARAIRACYRL